MDYRNYGSLSGRNLDVREEPRSVVPRAIHSLYFKELKQPQRF